MTFKEIYQNNKYKIEISNEEILRIILFDETDPCKDILMIDIPSCFNNGFSDNEGEK